MSSPCWGDRSSSDVKNASRTKHRNSYLYQGLSNVRISQCNRVVAEARQALLEKKSRSISSSKVNSYFSLLCLLDELEVRVCMPFHAAFDEYAAKVPSIYNSTNTKSAHVQFRDLVLQKDGLPVIIIEAGTSVHVMLMEKPVDNIKLCEGINTVIEESKSSDNLSKHSRLMLLASLFPAFKKLLSSAIDLAVVYCILSFLLSRTNMNLILKTNEIFSRQLCTETLQLAREAESKEVEAEEMADTYVQELVQRLTSDIEKSQERIQCKRRRCNQDEVDDLEFDIENKRQRLQKLKTSAVQVQQKKRKKRYYFNRWKSGLRRQLGKGKNRTRIDRSAETAVHSVLYETLKVHDRRWGDEGTGYIEGKRIQAKELRRIANTHLKSKGLPLIKSLETVRSWGKPRNKRSKQAKQHRGKGLWKCKRSEKKRSEQHVNIHYNRAHVKNYTRLLFKNSSPFKRFAVRRAIDDKAYLRCGTSEGFSRPLHTPVQLSGENLQFRLPSSDYPQECGYVSPGVILLVNDMNEVSYKDRDRYVKEDVTVTVTCKPKLVYPSTATNWFNDIYRIRYMYLEEHELETEVHEAAKSDPSHPENNQSATINKRTSTEASEVEQQLPCKEKESEGYNLSKKCQICLSVIRDSLFQFEMMNVKSDFIRSAEGGDHQRRELLRVNVLLERLRKFLPMVAEAEGCIKQMEHLIEILQKLKGTCTFSK